MSHRDSTDHEPLTERDLAVATLVGRYIERRESGRAPCVRDLFAAAEEFGDVAVDALRTLVACYEAMRASDDGASRHPRMARPGGCAGGGRSARQRGGPPPKGGPDGHHHRREPAPGRARLDPP